MILFAWMREAKSRILFAWMREAKINDTVFMDACGNSTMILFAWMGEANIQFFFWHGRARQNYNSPFCMDARGKTE